MYLCFLFLSALYTSLFFFFFFNDTATTEIYTLSLHDALPISLRQRLMRAIRFSPIWSGAAPPSTRTWTKAENRSEEHTSELQSRSDLVCRLLLEKKKKQTNPWTTPEHKRHAHESSHSTRPSVS